MAVSLDGFRRILRARCIPHYAYPRSEDPYDVFRMYRVSPVSVTREVKHGAVTKTQTVRVTSAIQQKIYKTLAKLTPPYPPYVIGISSVPNDVLALETAGYITHALLNNNAGLRWQWWNSWKYVQQTDEHNSDVVVIHNVATTSDRLQRLRDVLVHFSNSLRIVVLGGTNAIDFFDNYLNHGLSGMIHLTGRSEEFLVPPTYKSESKDKAEDAAVVFSPDLFHILRKATAVADGLRVKKDGPKEKKRSKIDNDL